PQALGVKRIKTEVEIVKKAKEMGGFQACRIISVHCRAPEIWNCAPENDIAEWNTTWHIQTACEKCVQRKMAVRWTTKRKLAILGGSRNESRGTSELPGASSPRQECTLSKAN